MYSLWLSWKHLVHKPAQLTLNLVLIALSTGLIAAVLLFSRMLTNRLDRNLAGVDMVIGAKGSPLQLVLAGMYHIDVPTGNISLEEAQAFLRPGHPLIATAVPLSLGDSHKGYRIVGTDARFLDLYQLGLADGKPFENPMEVVAGSRVARLLGLKIGSTFQSTHGLDHNEDLIHEESQPFVVTGILEPSGTVADQLLLTPTESVWMVHSDHGHSHSDTESMTPDGEDHVHGPDCGHDHPAHEEHADERTVDREITSVLIRFKVRNHLTLNMPRSINENTNLQAASPAIELNRLYGLMGTGVSMLRWLAIVIMIAAGLSIFVSLYGSLKERRYELALLRVMGSSPAYLFRLILTEGLLLAFIGAVLGIVLAHAGISLAGHYLEQEWRYAFPADLFLVQELWLMGIVVVFGVLAALLPAWQARKVDIAQTLTEG